MFMAGVGDFVHIIREAGEKERPGGGRTHEPCVGRSEEKRKTAPGHDSSAINNDICFLLHLFRQDTGLCYGIGCDAMRCSAQR